MRKVTYLLVIMFSLVLGSTSCNKGDEVTPTEKEVVVTGVQSTDIVGNWEFVSLEFNGKTYTSCDTELNRDYNMVTMGISDVTTTSMYLYTNCVDNGVPWGFNYTYTVKDNVISVNDINIKYQIMNAATFDGTNLKLKFIDVGHSSNLPLNGTYTLRKQ